MDWGRIGRWLLLAGSLVMGIVAGLIGSRIFDAKVPAAMRTTVLSAETKFYFIGTGVVFGLVIFAWTMFATWIARKVAESAERREAAPPAGR